MLATIRITPLDVHNLVTAIFRQSLNVDDDLSIVYDAIDELVESFDDCHVQFLASCRMMRTAIANN